MASKSMCAKMVLVTFFSTIWSLMNGKRIKCTNDSMLIEFLLKPSSYQPYKIPKPDGVVVDVEYWIQGISSVSEVRSDFEVDAYINEIWMDPGLRFDSLNPCKNNITLNDDVRSRIWGPNTNFVNSKVALIHDSPFRNVFLMVFPNGTIWANYRVKISGPCFIDLFYFPMDTQYCMLLYESYNYNHRQVRLQWSPRRPDPVWAVKPIVLPHYNLLEPMLAECVPRVRLQWSPRRPDPVWAVKPIVLPHYSLLEPMLAECVPRLKSAGYWITLRTTFVFKRRYVWYFLQAYIPAYLTIFISWVSFTLGSRAIPARTVLGVNALLAMILLFGNVMKDLPRVSYVKAIDVWLLGCMLFIFASLMELAVIGYLTAREMPADIGMGPIRRHYYYYVYRYRYKTQPNKDIKVPQWKKILAPEAIDKVASLLFPAMFSTFNIAYWSFYSRGSTHTRSIIDSSSSNLKCNVTV